jgi:uncharacterized protein YdbL (DUF1318 family)
MKYFYSLSGLFIFLFLSGKQIDALTLAQALNDKKVCEKDDGYLKATPGNEQETADLVNYINNERHAVYSAIGTKDNVDPSLVAREKAQLEIKTSPDKFCR